MGKLQKTYSLTVAIMAALCLLLGIGVSVLSWVLMGRTPKSISEHTIDPMESSQSLVTFFPFWWGGLGFIVPGILGIVAGFTRNSCLMVFYLIFNILCMVATLAMSVIVALLLVAWTVVNQQLDKSYGGCVTIYYGGKKCVCGNISGQEWTMDGVTCDTLKDIDSLLGALISLGALAALIAFVASYVSCCSLCNQEKEQIIVVRPITGGYQSDQHHNMGYPPQQNMGYAPHQNMGNPPQQNVGYPPPQDMGYQSHENMGYAPQQNMGYPPQQKYSPQQNMGYQAQQQNVGNPPQQPINNYPPPSYQSIDHKDDVKLLDNQPLV